MNFTEIEEAVTLLHRTYIEKDARDPKDFERVWKLVELCRAYRVPITFNTLDLCLAVVRKGYDKPMEEK